MSKEENLRSPEDSSQETPEQEEVSNELKKMAGGMEDSGKKESKFTVERSDVNREYDKEENATKKQYDEFLAKNDLSYEDGRRMNAKLDKAKDGYEPSDIEKELTSLTDKLQEINDRRAVALKEVFEKHGKSYN